MPINYDDVPYYSSIGKWDADMKVIKDRLLWIDENIGPDHPEYLPYLDEVAELEDQKTKLENKKPQQAKGPVDGEFFPDTTESSTLMYEINKIRHNLYVSEHNPRPDPIESQLRDLVKIAQMFGMPDLAKVLYNSGSTLVSRAKMEMESRLGRTYFDNYSNPYSTPPRRSMNVRVEETIDWDWLKKR